MSVFIGEIGKQIVISLNADILEATTITFLGKKPSGTTFTWDAAITGTDSAYYLTSSGDLDEEGPYFITPKVEFDEPYRLYFGVLVRMLVKEILE